MHLDIADGIEGILKVKLRTQGGKVAAIKVQSTRPLRLPRIFHGRSTDEVLTMIPRLYGSNPAAQSYAAVTAFESALGLSTKDTSMALRNLVVKTEILYEHLLRLLFDWPRLVGESPFTADTERFQSQLNRFREAVDPQSEAFAFNQRGFRPELGLAQQILQEISQGLEERLYNLPLPQWLHLGPEEMARWMRESNSLGAQMMRDLAELGHGSLGKGRVKGLPWLSVKEIREDLRIRDAEEYAQQPTLKGEVYETTPLSRMLGNGSMGELRSMFGDGLTLRLLSRLRETAQCAGELGVDLAQPQKSHLFGQPRGVATQGISQIEAARGKLIHHVELDGHKVKNYLILAPTDWNFHPKGILAYSLVGQPHQSAAKTKQMAELMVHALDPCVGCEVSLEEL